MDKILNDKLLDLYNSIFLVTRLIRKRDDGEGGEETLLVPFERQMVGRSQITDLFFLQTQIEQ